MILREGHQWIKVLYYSILLYSKIIVISKGKGLLRVSSEIFEGIKYQLELIYTTMNCSSYEALSANLSPRRWAITLIICNPVMMGILLLLGRSLHFIVIMRLYSDSYVVYWNYPMTNCYTVCSWDVLFEISHQHPLDWI
jgi:hypothetical protein